MTNREIGLALRKHLGIVEHEGLAKLMRLAADRLAPPTRRIAIEGGDPIKAFRQGKVTQAEHAVAVYDAVRKRVYGSLDPTIQGTEHRNALIRVRLLVRREFDGDAAQAARFMSRAVQFFKAREKRNRWPGCAGDATLERICHPRILDAYRLGEINREIGRV